MFLKDRDWRYPLENLDRKFDEYYDNVKSERFHIDRGDFLREWRFLEIIWGRLQTDFKVFYENSYQKLGKTEDDFKQNVKKARFRMHSFDCIQLDTQCFFLNARILMDRIAQLTKLFRFEISEEKIRNKKFRSFKSLKNKIKELYENGKIKDKHECFAKKVIQQTDWFDKELKDIRDTLMAHRDERSYVDMLKPDGTVIKGKAMFKKKEGNTVVEYEMKEIPNLNELMDCICDFMHFFDNHFSRTR